LALPLFAFIFLTPLVFSRQGKTALAYLLSLVFSLVLAAYYVIPVLAEKSLIVSSGPFNYLDHFPFIRQLIYSPWSYQGSNPFSSDTMSFQIGLINLVVIAAALIFLIRAKQKAIQLAFILAAAFLVIFLMNIRSDFIWQGLPLLAAIQFPWRLLMFTTIITPVLFLLMVTRPRPGLVKPLAAIVIIGAIALNISYFRPGQVTDRGDDYYLTRLLPGSPDYDNFAEDYAPLPQAAVRPKQLPAKKLSARNKETQIEIENDNPFNYQAMVNVISQDELTYHVFNYPGWRVEINGQSVLTATDEIGAITFPVFPDSQKVTIKYQDTPLRRFSNIISLTAIITAAAALILTRKKHETR